MLKDLGMEVPKRIETRCSMQAKAGDDIVTIITCVIIVASYNPLPLPAHPTFVSMLLTLLSLHSLYPKCKNIYDVWMACNNNACNPVVGLELLIVL